MLVSNLSRNPLFPYSQPGRQLLELKHASFKTWLNQAFALGYDQPLGLKKKKDRNMPGDIKRLNTLWVNKQQVERFPFLKDFLKYPFDIKGSKRKERGTQKNNTLRKFCSVLLV